VSVSQAPALLLAFVAGLGLGLFYFGGLWLTVRRLPAARQPALLALGSMLARTVVVVAVLWLLLGLGVERLLAGVAGFLVMRTALVRGLRPGKDRDAEPVAAAARGPRAP